jgi:MerC mercury resistance protein
MLHCLATPLLLVASPSLGGLLAGEWFHGVILAVVIPVAIWAFWQGYRQHGRSLVLILGSLGLALVVLALLGTAHHSREEVILMSSAGLLLVAAHVLNLRGCRAHQGACSSRSTTTAA